jgi:hypothetical protein
VRRFRLALKPATAKIIDLDTTVDVVPVESREGPIVWATVKMEYTLAGLKPAVTICVPVPWDADETQNQRRAQALRCARQLIEHACRAAGVGPLEAIDEDNAAQSVIDAITPIGIERLPQELGPSEPAPQPKKQRGG